VARQNTILTRFLSATVGNFSYRDLSRCDANWIFPLVGNCRQPNFPIAALGDLGAGAVGGWPTSRGQFISQRRGQDADVHLDKSRPFGKRRHDLRFSKTPMNRHFQWKPGFHLKASCGQSWQASARVRWRKVLKGNSDVALTRKKFNASNIPVETSSSYS